MKLEDGTVVLVPQKIYKAYWKLRNHQRYLEKLDRDHAYEFLLADKDVSSLKSDDDVEQAVEDNVLIQLLQESLKSLSDEEREIIKTVFFDNVSLRQAAKKFGVSHQALSKRVATILYKLRQSFEDKI